MTNTSVFRLLQISDSAFPRGSFAQSLGLETYVHEGVIADKDSLAEFIENILTRSTATLDGVYLREAWGLSDRDDLDGLMEIDRAFSAARPVASLRVRIFWRYMPIRRRSLPVSPIRSGTGTPLSLWRKGES